MSEDEEPIPIKTGTDAGIRPKGKKESSNTNSIYQLNDVNANRMTEPSLHSTSKSNFSDLATLAAYKNRRKRVQQDVDLLHNRIKMLRMEEEKAMKKIQETRK